MIFNSILLLIKKKHEINKYHNQKSFLNLIFHDFFLDIYKPLNFMILNKMIFLFRSVFFFMIDQSENY